MLYYKKTSYKDQLFPLTFFLYPYYWKGGAYVKRVGVVNFSIGGIE